MQPLEHAHLQTIEHYYMHRNSIGRTRAYWHIGRYLTHFIDMRLVAKAEAIPMALAQLRLMARYYQTFPHISEALTWTHYCHLLKIQEEERRQQYLEACLENHWTTTQLARQISTHFLERKQSSQHPHAIHSEHILEFLELTPEQQVQEHQLEGALIDKMKDFLLELGKGFAFVARQQIVRTNTGKAFRIDLVFYHYLLKCFVVVDLKTTPLTHRDIGQMDTYLRLFEAKWRKSDDNPTLGILLTTHNDQSLLHYSMLKEHQYLLASKYQFHLPSDCENV